MKKEKIKIVKSEYSIGANSTRIPNLIIGKDWVGGADSVVTKNFPGGVALVGNPARNLK